MTASIRLDAEPESVGRARRFCSATLAGWGLAVDVVDTCVLLVSELSTNAVLHARTPFVVTVVRGTTLRVEVRDGDPRMPHMRDYGPEAVSGRGLQMLEVLAQESGVRPDADGKAVWFTLSWTEEAVS